MDAPKIRHRRAWEMGSVAARALEDGHRLVFFTLTVRHSVDQSLLDVWLAVGKGWTAATSGKMWQRACAAIGLVGWMRVQEVGFGANGWHPHIHGILVVPGGTSDEAIDDLFDGIFGRWQRAAERTGLERPERWAQEWHAVEGENAAEDLGTYLAKIAEVEGVGLAMGLELTHAMPGRSKRRGTVPVWQLLDAARLDGDADALRAWWEFERVSKGKRMIGYSRSLRELYPLEEKSDEEIADEEIGSRDDRVVSVTRDGYAAAVRVPGLPLMVVEAAERGGAEAASAVLSEWGIDHEVYL